MKNLFLMTLCVVFSHSAISQQKTTSPIEGEYLEVRFIVKKGMSYRLAPDLPFQKTGLFNKNLKPYFKQYDESLRYHKQYNRSYLGLIGGATIYSAGFMTSFVGILENRPNVVRVGTAAGIGGLAWMLWANHINVSSIYKAVDAYNRNKNPNTQTVDYLEVATHPINIWQFRTNPSESYKSTGLYGKKLKPYFEEDPAAYNAYKKYKAGHIIYSLGNVAMITGIGMTFTGFITNSSSLSRTGLSTSASGLIAALLGNNAMNKNLYQAIDLINYKKLPVLNSSLIPSLQPSSHSAGLGLVWNID